ncbi:MAG TPA: hypothetical protein VM554_02230 [Acidisarcina sp.]|nr:hypothetical protein [Acidisarcina sp.]
MPNHLARNTAGFVSGVGIALALNVCGIGLLLLSQHLFPALGKGQVPWPAWFLVFAVPEATSLLATVALWQKKRPFALGILLWAIAMGTHFTMHVASHWSGR